MTNLQKGEVLINNIEISMHDTLTDILRKTINFSKRVINVNNYQHLFFENISFYKKQGYIEFIFFPTGTIESISFCLSENNKGDESELLEFLKDQKIILMKEYNYYKKSFEWGCIGIYNDIHYPGHYSLLMRPKETN